MRSTLVAPALLLLIACSAHEPTGPTRASAPPAAGPPEQAVSEGSAQVPPPDATARPAIAPELVEAAGFDSGEGVLIGGARRGDSWVVATRTNDAAGTQDIITLRGFPDFQEVATHELPPRCHAGPLLEHDGQLFLTTNDLGDDETIEVWPFGGQAPTTRAPSGRSVLMSAFRDPDSGVVVLREGRGSVARWVDGGRITRSTSVATSTGQAAGASAAGLVTMHTEPGPGLGPFGPLTVAVVETNGDTWRRTSPTPETAGAGGAVVVAASGAVHVFLHGRNFDELTQPSWWRIPREGPLEMTPLPSTGEGHARGHVIAACASGVVLLQARRHGDEVAVRAWMGADPATAAPLELWRGVAESFPRVHVACSDSEALAVIGLAERTEAFRLTRRPLD